MNAWIEYETDGRRQRVQIERRMTIGSDPSNDVHLADPLVSTMHAAIDPYPSGCTVSDLGSKNGTAVNGERIGGPQVLRSNDQIAVGPVMLRYVSDQGPTTPTAVLPSGSAPSLTPRETDVLKVLCGPVLLGDAFTQPATPTEIATRLDISRAAVKQHLRNLYRKFRIPPTDDRRARLAREAIDVGAVTPPRT